MRIFKFCELDLGDGISLHGGKQIDSGTKRNHSQEGKYHNIIEHDVDEI
jgi:hypothetical protein